MPAPVRRVVAGALLAALAAPTTLTACSGEDPGSTPTPPASSTTGTAVGSASPSAEPAPATTEPLVLVAHHGVGELRLSPRDVRAVRAGRLDDWSRLDGSDRPLRLVTSLARVAADPDSVALLPASEVRPWVRAAVVGGVEPMRDPASYPIRVDGPAPPEVTTLTVAGDVMLDRRVAESAAPAGPVSLLRPLRAHLSAADLTVANLESTLSEDGEPLQDPVTDSFAAPPSVLPALARLGIDALSLANNHTGDYGTPALLRTIRAFRGSGLRSFGAGRDLAAASEPAVLEANGVSFGFVGFNSIGETLRATEGTPGALSLRMPPRTGPLDRADLRHLLGTVRRLDRSVDVVVVLPHWGEQYTHTPWPQQSYVARRLAAAGADLVAGGHPHVVQGLERAGAAVVAHSLGNLVFDMDFNEEAMEGVLLDATFWGDRLVAVDLVPYRMDASFSPRPVTGAEAAPILDDVRSTSTGPFRSP